MIIKMKMKTDKRVQFSEKVEVFGNLSQERISCVCEPCPTLVGLVKEGRDFPYK